VLKTALIVAGVLLLVVVAVVAVGYALPQSHVASRETVIAQPPERIYRALTEVERYPGWRSDVQKVDVLSQGPAARWREHGSNGTITFEVAEHQAPARLVSRIADRSLPFGGTWTYELSGQGQGTRLKITEHGEVYNPVFRFMSRFVFGHTATMDRFLSDLTRHLAT
jgi:uncharacterized protein YndB with AHSA1/START domain